MFIRAIRSVLRALNRPFGLLNRQMANHEGQFTLKPTHPKVNHHEPNHHYDHRAIKYEVGAAPDSKNPRHMTSPLGPENGRGGAQPEQRPTNTLPPSDPTKTRAR